MVAQQLKSKWQNQPVTVLGLSKTGLAAAQYLASAGAAVFLSETMPATPGNEASRIVLSEIGIPFEMGGHTAQCFQHSHLVIASPGIPPTGSVIEQLALSGQQIISEVELAYRETSVPMIGITGTNGKSTTTTLISEILTQSGLNAPACGNIGVPIISLLKQHPPADFLVAELSSFQLAFSPTLKAKIAVFTNLTPDHVEWHGSLEAYKQAKLRLFVGEQSPEWVVLNAADAFSQEILQHTTSNILAFAISPDQVSGYDHCIFVDPVSNVVTFHRKDKPPLTLFDVRQLKIIGEHNIENVLASVAVACLLEIDPGKIASACLNFRGLAHRLERVWFDEDKSPYTQIAFYNDSKATNPESSISALKAFPKNQPVVFIAGGYDKMTPLDALAAEVKAHAAHVVLLGKAADRFYTALQAAGISSIEISPDKTGLEDAVRRAVRLSFTAGDSPYPILFSPACASFDMFKNYEERGDVFKQIVRSLQHEEAICRVP